MSQPSKSSETRPVRHSVPPFSKYFYLRSCLEYYTAVYVGVKYNTLPSLPDLYTALAELIEANPQLGLQVFTDEDADINATEYECEGKMVKPDPPTNVYAAQIDKIDFSEVVTFSPNIDINDSQTIANVLLKEKFEFGRSDKPLWNIVVLKDNWVMFTYDHTFLDGMSGVIFQEGLISYLNKPTGRSKEFENNSVYHVKKVADAKEFDIVDIYEMPKDDYKLKMWNYVSSLRPRLIKAANGVVEKLSLSPSVLGRWYVYDCNPKYVVTTRKFADNSVKVSINQADTLKLIKLGKKCGNISMNSLLCSLLTISTKGTLVTKEQAIKFLVPVNLRASYNQSPEQIGIMIKPMEVVSPVLKDELIKPSGLTPDLFWKYATELQTEVARLILSETTVHGINMMGLSDLIAANKSKEGGNAKIVFGHSNLSVQFKEYSGSSGLKHKYLVEDAVFNQSNICTHCTTASTISTLTGGTNMSFTFPDELKEEMEGTINNFKVHIQTLLEIAGS